MWAIPYIHSDLFGWVLFFAGNFLALSFAVLFVLTLADIWSLKPKRFGKKCSPPAVRPAGNERKWPEDREDRYR
jgi:hypothetical protein